MKSFSILMLLIICFGLPLMTAAAEVDIDKVLVRDMPREKMIEKFGRIPGEKILAADLAEMAAYIFEGDTLKLLAILVEWDNRLATYSAETMDSLIFSRNVLPYGSVADYIDEVSYGQVAVSGNVVGWYNAGHYNSNWGSSDFIDLLAELDPKHAPDFARNRDAFLAVLDELDRTIRELLEPLKNRRFMVFHPAWSYFAAAYGLTQVPIEGEGKEPGARTLAALIEQARREAIRVVFVQPQFDDRLAAQVARAIDGSIIVADPLAGDYVDNLRRVAQQLAQAMQS